MKILGIDTATKFLSIGACDGHKIYEYNLEAGRLLSTLLVPTLERILKALGWKISEVDYFALGLGPGSFTGIRQGVSVIKGLSFSTGKPIVGISTLDILAKNVQVQDEIIVPVMDARRSLVYTSAYKIKHGALKRIAPYMLLSQEELSRKIKGRSFVFGDGVGTHKDYWYPRGHNLIEVALERIKTRQISNTFKIKPIYLYPKECQIKSV